MKASNYKTDFYTWTQQQAALLKSGRLSEIDVKNIIEEIETIGRSERRQVQSRLTVLLQHLLKWEYQPKRRGRSWAITIKQQRLKLNDVLADNPGLIPQLSDLLQSAYLLAVLNAAEETGLDETDFPAKCPWTLEDITDQDFLPGDLEQAN